MTLSARLVCVVTLTNAHRYLAIVRGCVEGDQLEDASAGSSQPACKLPRVSCEYIELAKITHRIGQNHT